ncbi:MAG: methyltransferase domain-containing protein [Burkholderiaceae bacterium]|nr:methyltransferase domain-containing protein [Burkholderiaceae bacterium]
MGHEIIGTHAGLDAWLETPPGRYLLDWEQSCMDAAVADLFGYHALQLGLPALDALRANRMPHRWLARGTGDAPMPGGAAGPKAAFATAFEALPFAEASLDLVVLPHTLEMSLEPHATLREVQRVLVPEGHVVITGFNPASLWGLSQRRAHLWRRLGTKRLFLPQEGEFIGYWRLRDWLRLLGFEVESGRFGCWRPAFAREGWLGRMQWMDRAGERWWPIFGAAYCVVATKRVHGMRLMDPGWKTAPKLAPAPVTAAQRNRRGRVPAE